MERATGRKMSPEEAAEGFIAIANQHMAEAIRKISIQRGYDPRDYVLVRLRRRGRTACLRGGGCGRRIATILLHPLAGVLSAWGMGLADLRAIREVSVEEKLGADLGGADLEPVDTPRRKSWRPKAFRRSSSRQASSHTCVMRTAR